MLSHNVIPDKFQPPRRFSMFRSVAVLLFFGDLLSSLKITEMARVSVL
jgi:hypothetical protein